MKLYFDSLQKVKNGEKDIEIRLNDAKRQRIKLGDTILFLGLPDQSKTLKVEVSSLHPFASFRELLQQFPNKRFGHNEVSIDDQMKRIRKYYSEEEELKFGVLGIGIKLLD